MDPLSIRRQFYVNSDKRKCPGQCKIYCLSNRSRRDWKWLYQSRDFFIDRRISFRCPPIISFYIHWIRLYCVFTNNCNRSTNMSRSSANRHFNRTISFFHTEKKFGWFTSIGFTSIEQSQSIGLPSQQFFQMLNVSLLSLEFLLLSV